MIVEQLDNIDEALGTLADLIREFELPDETKLMSTISEIDGLVQTIADSVDDFREHRTTSENDYKIVQVQHTSTKTKPEPGYQEHLLISRKGINLWVEEMDRIRPGWRKTEQEKHSKRVTRKQRG